MAQTSPLQPSSDKQKSLVYLLSGLCFVLVLIEKSLGSSGNLPQVGEGFRNLGKSTALRWEERKEPILEKDWEDDLAWEEDALDPIPVGEDVIPVVDAFSKESSSPSTRENSFSESKPIQERAQYVPVYFLKFYGQGKKTQSQLVRVTREFPGGDPIPFILTELIKGPNGEEKEKAVLSAIPKRLRFRRGYRLENGILHLSFSGDLEIGGSPEILRDRLDQLTHSLVGNFGIKGLKIYIDQRKMNSMGGDGVPLPEVLAKEPRKTLVL